MPNTCLFIGRFQPLHNGHIMVIKGMKYVCNKIIIGVGSPEVETNTQNPLTIQERREMISAALLEDNITDATIVDCPDTPEDEDWVDEVLKVTGPVTTVWTGNRLVEKLFMEKGVKVQKISEVPGISATDVREKALAGDSSWKDLVPKSVASIMNRIDFEKRMKSF